MFRCRRLPAGPAPREALRRVPCLPMRRIPARDASMRKRRRLRPALHTRVRSRCACRRVAVHGGESRDRHVVDFQPPSVADRASVHGRAPRRQNRDDMAWPEIKQRLPQRIDRPAQRDVDELCRNGLQRVLHRRAHCTPSFDEVRIRRAASTKSIRDAAPPSPDPRACARRDPTASPCSPSRAAARRSAGTRKASASSDA